MKKTAIIVSEVLALSLLLTQSAYAGAANITIHVSPPRGVLTGNVSVATMIAFILTVLVVIGILAAIIFLIYGGIKWITSGGDKAAVESARNHIVAAIIGLVVIILSFVIINFVLQILGVAPDTIFNLQIPRLT